MATIVGSSIPGEIRKQLGLKQGDHLRIGVEDGKTVILTPEVLRAEFYDLTQNLRTEAGDVVQEFIDERRLEAEIEESFSTLLPC